MTVETMKRPANKPSWMALCEGIKDARVSTRLRRANSGLRYPSSSIVVSSAIPGTQYQTSHANNTTVSNTCNPAFYYASTCTLCVEPLQARPTKCCGRRSRYGESCPLLYVFLSYLTLCTEHFICSIFGITMLLYYCFCCCCCCCCCCRCCRCCRCCSHINSSLIVTTQSVRGHRTGSNN